MARFTVFRSQAPQNEGHPAPGTPEEGSLESRPSRTHSGGDAIAEEMRSDTRLKILGELPRALLVECDPSVATEWQARLPGWTFQLERTVKIPDTKQKVKRQAP